ncbi:four helix bundle protein [Patescibacteria group bacterium]|nr:four helix bundle protein [Patescibacteria group bacterium]
MHYSELRIYQIAKKLEQELERDLNKILFHWELGDVDQAKRSSSSSTTNIVEGHGRRFYVKDYIKFLNYSLASSDETQKHIHKLYTSHHLHKSKYEYFFRGYKDLSVRILNYINWLRNNCYT